MTTRETREVATSVVLTLLGGRLVYPPRRVVDRHYAPSPRINLTGRPVRNVLSVTDQNGQDVPFQFIGNGCVLMVELTKNSTWDSTWGPQLRNGCSMAKILYLDIEYECGVSEIPPPVLGAIDVLACELDKASAGEPCALPERITSISRQGLSWTVIDPQEFLQEGRTGIYAVDMILSAYNRSFARARARVFSPEFRPPIRLSEVPVSEISTH